MKKSSLLLVLTLVVNAIFALSSYTDSGNVTLDTVEPTLELISPNGGETWYIGDTKDILWTSTDTNLHPNGILLLYSLNGGTRIPQDAFIVYYNRSVS